MTVKMFARQVGAQVVEDYLTSANYERTEHWVAVEIFDHETSAFSKVHDAVTGPFVVGEADEVAAWLESHGYVDHETQYELEPYDG